MLQWFQRLMPRQDAFFPAFERHAAVMVKAAVALREMVAGGDQLKSRFQEILDFEHETDRRIDQPDDDRRDERRAQPGDLDSRKEKGDDQKTRRAEEPMNQKIEHQSWRGYQEGYARERGLRGFWRNAKMKAISLRRKILFHFTIRS